MLAVPHVGSLAHFHTGVARFAKRGLTSMGEPEATFDIVSDPDDADCVIDVRGDLVDLRSLAGLRGLLRDATAARPVMLVVDLAEVTSIDASGLAVLAAARRRGLDVGTRLLLQAPTASTLALLAETRFDQVLPILPDLQLVPLDHPSISHGDRPRRPIAELERLQHQERRYRELLEQLRALVATTD